MSDKWSKLSIYDVDFSLTDDDGEEHHFTFKPLPWAYYPKAFDVFGKIEASGLFESKEDMSDEDFVRHFFKSVSKDLVSELGEVCKIMVKHSYPDKKDEEIEGFVMGNLFSLIMPLSKVISRQGKQSRKAEKSLNESSSTKD